MVVREFAGATNRNQVGVRIQARCVYSDANIVRVNAAILFSKLPPQRYVGISDKNDMRGRSASDREHLARIVFALVLGFALDFEILFRGYVALRLRGHCFYRR